METGDDERGGASDLLGPREEKRYRPRVGVDSLLKTLVSHLSASLHRKRGDSISRWDILLARFLLMLYSLNLGGWGEGFSFCLGHDATSVRETLTEHCHSPGGTV